MRKRSIIKFLTMLLLMAQLFSLTAGVTVFAATYGDTIPLEPRPTPTATPTPTPELIPPPESELSELPEAYTRRYCTPGQTISMGGDTYENSVDFVLGRASGEETASIFYNLDGKYSLITFDAGYIRGADRAASLTVYGDGNLLLETGKLYSDDIPRSFTANVEGVKKLQFVFNSDGYDSTHYGVGNLRGVLVGELDTNVYESDPFYDMDRYKMSGTSVSEEFTMAGRSYKNGYQFSVGRSGSSSKNISFNFRKQYEELTFDVAKYNGGKEDRNAYPITMTIEADGVVIPEYDNLTIAWDALALPVKVDLTDVSQLTITFQNAEYDSTTCRMSNIQLKSNGVARGLVLDATPVEGTDDYTATLTDAAPTIALNPRVYPSDAPQDFEMTVAEGAEYITVTEAGEVTAIHGGEAVINFAVPDTDISVDCTITSKVTAHVWDEGEVTKEPTLDKQGEKKFTCTVCEKTKTEAIDKLTECEEHQWNEGEVTKEPTYTEAGEKLVTCTVCGKTETQVVDQLTCAEHAWADGIILKEPTYTEDGEKQYSCAYCSATKNEPIPKLICEEHQWDDGEVTKEPTVEAEGETLYTCTVCGETKTEAIAKIPETPSESETVPLPEPYNKRHVSGPQVLSMGGNSYSDGLQFNMGYNSGGDTTHAVINLDGKFSVITFDTGFVSGDNRKGYLTVRGDGNVLLDAAEVKPADIPRTYTLNVEGVKQLKFSYNSGGYDSAKFGIGNLRGVLIAELDTNVYRSDAVYDVTRYQLKGDLLSGEFEMGGKKYENGYSFRMGYNAGNTKSVSFNFKKQYEEMTFDVAKYTNKTDNYGHTVTMSIEVDGVTVPEYENVQITWDALSIPVKLNLKDVSQVTITFHNGAYDTTTCAMGNIQFKSNGKVQGILLDASPVSGSPNYTASLTDKAPEIALNPRVYPSDAPQEFEMKVQGNEYITIGEDYTVSGIHAGDAVLTFSVPNTDISVDCAITSKVTAHLWNEGTVTKEPTLTQKGEILYACTVCEKTKKEDIDKLTECEEHKWNDGEVTKEPTYEKEGEMLFTCTVCGKTKTEPIATDNMCGENLYWSVEDGVLTIYTENGESNMYSYEKGTAPWYPLRDSIHTIKMVNGLTIGENAFYNLHKVTRVELPVGLIYFQNAFEGCTALAEFSFPAGSDNGYSLANNGTMILRKADYDDMDSMVLYACAPASGGTAVVPAGIDTIHFGAFEGCGITDLYLPASLKLVLPGAFKNCPNLEIVHYCGSAEDWAAVTVDGDEANGGNDALDAAALHLQVFVPEKDVTCTEDGCDAHYYCADCDLYFDAQDPTVSLTDSPVKPAVGHKWNDGEIAKEPTYTEEGETLFTCENCGETKTEAIDKLTCTKHDWDDGKLIKEPTYTESGERLFTCKICGSTLSEVLPQLVPTNPFDDIQETDWYYDAVLWAYTNNVTGGVAPGVFGPNASCTRGQVVTFLWAAAGKPEPKTTNNPFADVAESDYYYKAVLWAVENGITSGIAADLFGPDQSCTRGQIVTFLWAANGRPEPSLSMNPFIDFDESAYYYKPILWAVQNGITTGIGDGMFGPDNTCTRCQIVMFLYKANHIAPNPDEEPAPEVSPEPQLPLVTDAYSEDFAGQYNIHHCYHIPRINLPDDLAKDWNRQIYDKLMETIEKRVHKEMDKYGRPSQRNMIYAWGQKGDLVSIVMREDEQEYDWTTHTFYTVSTKTGKQVDSSEIYAAYGMTEEQFYDAVEIVLAAVMSEQAEYYKDLLSAEKIQELIDKTLSEENIKSAEPFISADGTLSFRGSTYSPAGAGRYYYLWTIDGENITITCNAHKK